LSWHAVLVDLVLFYCLGQPLPLLHVLLPGVEHFVFWIIHGRRWWVTELDLSVFVSDDYVL
jgi:hypothetical protein